MSKPIRRKYLTQASRRNQLDIPFWVDLVNLTKEKERIRGIKAAKRRYHRVMVEEEMMIVVVIKTQIKESHGILNPAEKLI